MPASREFSIGSTGKCRTGVPAGTRFDIIPAHQPVYFNVISFERLKNLQLRTERKDYSLVKLALAWGLLQAGVSTVLAAAQLAFLLLKRPFWQTFKLFFNAVLKRNAQNKEIVTQYKSIKK